LKLNKHKYLLSLNTQDIISNQSGLNFELLLHKLW